MGKSSAAKAVLHDEEIVKKFQDHRYFVRYDNMDASQVSFDTFFNRIARALGMTASKGNLQNSVSTYIVSQNMLLVLDNAETFLDAPRDASRIAAAIDNLGALTSVAIMLTTRSKALPSNLIWERLAVPGLESYPAHKAFTAIYPKVISPEIVDQLLSTLDFHPLSINLLAQAATQSDWSPEDLVESWERQKTRLLDSGSDKAQNLAVTIELSLNSPPIKNLGDDARHFLQMVAFLPQGVDRGKLTDLFPSVSNIFQIADTLCKQSLTDRKGNLFTMLAPIRLYISSECNSPYANPLFTGIKSYYYSKLAQYADIEPGQPNFDEGAWINTEDSNVELLVILDLSIPENIETSCKACVHFTKTLMSHKPRPTAIRPAIMALPEDLNNIAYLPFSLLRPLARKRTLRSKGKCLLHLGLLAWRIGQSTEAVELLRLATLLFLRGKDENAASLCMVEIANIYCDLGKFAAVEELLDKATKRKHIKSSYIKGRLHLSLGVARMFTGKSEALELFAKARRYFERAGDKRSASEAMNFQAYGELYAGNNVAAIQHFEAELSLHVIMNNDSGRSGSLLGLSEVLSRQGELSRTNRLLDEALTLALKAKDVLRASVALSYKASITADQGDFARSRDQITRAITLSKFADESENYGMSICVYTLARNELLAHEYSKAKELFLRAMDHFDVLSEVRFKARCARALGEIALLEKDIAGAKARFTEAQVLCNSMGIPQELLYICFNCYALKDTFEGWAMFQEGRL